MGPTNKNKQKKLTLLHQVDFHAALKYLPPAASKISH